MFMRAKFLFSIWYFDNQVAFREKRFEKYWQKYRKLIKLERTSTERKYANRRLQGKTLPRVSLNEENFF